MNNGTWNVLGVVAGLALAGATRSRGSRANDKIDDCTDPGWPRTPPSYRDFLSGIRSRDEAVRAAATRWSAFHRWFDDSAVVDSTGRPLVVYHGGYEELTGGAFSRAVRARHAGGRVDRDEGGAVFYFTDSANAASAYAGHKVGQRKTGRVIQQGGQEYPEYEPVDFVWPEGGNQVYPVYLRIETPHIIHLPDRNPNAVLGIDPALGWRQHVPLIHRLRKAWKREKTRRARGETSENVPDGIIFRNMIESLDWTVTHGPLTTYVVFDPEQVKSAVGNRGTWSREDARINFNRKTASGKSNG